MIKDGERLVTLEVKMKSIEKKLDDHVDEQRKDFDLLFTKLDAMNGKFAGKWVEKITIGIGITVVAGLVIFIITRGGV